MNTVALIFAALFVYDYAIHTLLYWRRLVSTEKDALSTIVIDVALLFGKIWALCFLFAWRH